MSSIQWTDRTWNPTLGCSRVSPGCEHCYAEGVAHRGMQEAHRGLTVLGKNGPRWNGKIRQLPDRLETPLRWKTPQRVFVDSMSDLFHEGVPFEYIDRVFATMAISGHVRRCRRRGDCDHEGFDCESTGLPPVLIPHTFQVLTKRTWRAAEYLNGPDVADRIRQAAYETPGLHMESGTMDNMPWPLHNVWMGTSIEDQKRSDERLTALVMCPATIRFLSVEPMLGPVELGLAGKVDGNVARVYGASSSVLRFSRVHQTINWVICGGESGGKARGFNIAWARALRDECAAFGVPFFLKQLGAKPLISRLGLDGEPLQERLVLESGKGDKMHEWPEDLRLRQWPEEEAHP